MYKTCLILLKEDTFYLHLIKTQDSFYLEGELFLEEDCGDDFWGFYGWLSDFNGNVTGLAFQPFNEIIPQCVLENLVRVGKRNSSTNYIIVPVSDRRGLLTSPNLPGDEASFGGNKLFVSDFGSIAFSLSPPDD